MKVGWWNEGGMVERRWDGGMKVGWWNEGGMVE